MQLVVRCILHSSWKKKRISFSGVAGCARGSEKPKDAVQFGGGALTGMRPRWQGHPPVERGKRVRIPPT